LQKSPLAKRGKGADQEGAKSDSSSGPRIRDRLKGKKRMKKRGRQREKNLIGKVPSGHKEPLKVT